MTEKVIIIDGLNNFLRSYIVDPSVSKNGSPFGGCKGFLKSLQKLTREIKPSLTVIVWDGTNGSKRKKKLFSEYKDGRKPIHLNRNNEVFKNLSEDEETNNRNVQFVKLIEYLNLMPVIQLVEENVEADDIIARICNLRSLQGKIKIIISSDKDFFQLCDQETIIFRPIQKETMNINRVIDRFGIHPRNFALARSIAGDPSDNLDGIGGAGLKTVAKRLPFLKEDKDVTLKDLYSYCEKNEKNIKFFNDVLENKDKIELNYKIMQLYSPNISPQTAKKIKDTFDNYIPEFNQTEVIKKMIMDGITDYNWDFLFQNFRSNVATNNKLFKTS